METEEPKDVMVLGAVMRGEKKFEKIQKATKVDPAELNSILEDLEKRGFIQVIEKKTWLGRKIEILITEDGAKEVDARIHELQDKWTKMATIYKTGDKKKMKNCMDNYKSFLPMMLFFGVMDIMMFSMMFSMMGMPMADYVPAESMPDGAGDGMDGADGGDGGAGDGMDGDMGGGFDFDVGF